MIYEAWGKGGGGPRMGHLSSEELGHGGYVSEVFRDGTVGNGLQVANPVFAYQAEQNRTFNTA